MENKFEKHETLYTILLIVFYVVVNSYLVQNFGIADYRSSLVNIVISIFFIVLLKKLNRSEYYGIRKVDDCKKYLYFIPLIVIATVNLWGKVSFDKPISEILFYIITMINVGFIEEVIFRGFLFKMMAKENVKRAMVVSALTFGIGHIVNLLNGAEFVSTIMQVCYAVCLGYLFVVIFYKSKSLIPCIVTHGVINSLAVFRVSDDSLLIISIILIVISLSYAVYINRSVK